MDGEQESSPPFLFSNYIYKWLDTALDYGISEEQFWNMTFAELDRYIQSQNRRKKAEAQERATFDYLLADLMGRSVARIYSSSNTMPDISEVYPTIFDSQQIKEQKQVKKDELSILRFKQFANFHNNRIKEVRSVSE